MPKLVCIAGGSGSGKTTLAIALCKKYPRCTTLVHLDDYYKKAEETPAYEKGVHWDRPDSLRFDDLERDVKSLLDGKPVSILTKSEWYHGAYDPVLKNKIPWTLVPRSVVILEGHLALYDARIRRHMTLGIFLDMPIAESVKRRSSNKIAQPRHYFELALFPAHDEFVEPTKEYAELVIDMSVLNPADAFLAAESAIKRKIGINDDLKDT